MKRVGRLLSVVLKVLVRIFRIESADDNQAILSAENPEAVGHRNHVRIALGSGIWQHGVTAVTARANRVCSEADEGNAYYTG